MTSEELRDLFTLHENCPSHLYLKLKEAGFMDEGQKEKQGGGERPVVERAQIG